PDLTRKQQPLGHTYAAILIFGYCAGRAEFDDKPNDYIKLLDVLLSAGVPVDDPDITGMTALHYAAKWTGTGDLIKVLLKHKATINSQDRFGASPLLIAIRNHTVDVIPVLLDAGASLDVTDAEGSSPRSIYSTRPPEVSNVVKNWLLEHKGKKAALEGDECSKCGTRTASIKRCARCRSRLYCSPECQKVDWKEHKRSCQPFDKEENLLIVTPTYHYGGRTFLSTISTVPSTFGDVRGPTSGRGFETNVRDGKNMVVKIQVPLDVGGLFVYNKKRNFQCFLDYNKNPAAYTRITQIINQKGILGMKAYFAAELRSKDVLAINVAECLPEARF
ncbi:hypothetical protein BDM02DRAFT_3097041, partial [Thelephora ganbajun]